MFDSLAQFVGGTFVMSLSEIDALSIQQFRISFQLKSWIMNKECYILSDFLKQSYDKQVSGGFLTMSPKNWLLRFIFFR